MFGGTETVAIAIEWALADLLTSPHDLKRVQEELAMVVGLRRKVHESHLHHALTDSAQGPPSSHTEPEPV